MAVKILTETNSITGTMGTVSALAADVQGNAGAVKNAKSALDWQVQARGGIDGQLSGLIRRLNRQEQLLRQLNAVAQGAAGKADTRTQLLSRKASEISYVMPLMTAAVAVRSNAGRSVLENRLLSGLFGVSASAGASTSARGAFECLLKKMKKKKKEDSKPKEPELTEEEREEIRKRIEKRREERRKKKEERKKKKEEWKKRLQRIIEILRDPEKVQEELREQRRQANLNEVQARFDALKKPTLEEGAKNPWDNHCTLLARDQLIAQGLATKDDPWRYGYEMASAYANKGKTSTGAICEGYPCDDATEKSTFDRLLENNADKMPITNVLVSFSGSVGGLSSKGHGCLISKIEDGYVFLIDNTYLCREGNQYVAKCMTIEEFKNDYFRKGGWQACYMTHVHF